MKKLFAMLVACAMLAAFAVTASAFTIDLSTFPNGDETYITDAGSPDVTLDGTKLFITNRVNSWDAMDVNLDWLDPGDYTITATMEAEGEQKFRITCHTGAWLAEVDETGGATLSVDFTVNADKSVDTKKTDGAAHTIKEDSYGPARMRVDTESRTDYYIVKVEITGGNLDAAVATEPVAAEEPVAETPVESAVETPTETVAEAPVTTTAAPVAGNTAAASDDTKQVDSGVASVAIATGLALVAAGGVVLGKKRK
ncbi:MAG: hypothetical protein FWH20_03605 [Oscillospiraceae bacterium]|nr:hypothetical protein [Oscillospiraceae bacterium]